MARIDWREIKLGRAANKKWRSATGARRNREDSCTRYGKPAGALIRNCRRSWLGL
ncbi:hypothetical protein TIFTF001_015065 [Ficus carica]|uniref:Uncharacterized protein n=1 Tax=Ficus carica TaxID=3494 RepID=A0AA88D7I7_FICCA|nr:hypothetical protein TIFTF001_015065 [Ficus carica]